MPGLYVTPAGRPTPDVDAADSRWGRAFSRSVSFGYQPYVRNGSVFHLAVEENRVEAQVSGSEIDKVTIEFKALVKGARLDSEPELLFTLRGVDQRELVPKIAAAPAAKRSLAKPAPVLKKKPAPAKSKKSAPVAKAPKALPAKKAKAVSRR